MIVLLQIILNIFILGTHNDVLPRETIGQTKNELKVLIDKEYDLGGDTLRVPSGMILKFIEDGTLMNGVLVGDSTIIEARLPFPIFKNMEFEGSFKGRVKSHWFPLKYGVQVDNSKELNSALQLTYLSSIKTLKLKNNKTLFVRSDIETSNTKDFLRAGTVEIKSGVCFDLNRSTIRCLPNNAKAYNIIFSRCSDSIIIRNGVICGDGGKHTGNHGEWGYGIELQGVHGFILEDLVCKCCWGDGINLQVAFDGDGNPSSNLTHNGHCIDGLIKNVKCSHNRRQGLSVEGVIGLQIIKSRFCHTDGTNPRSGIDIEPYTNNNLVRDVFIEKCIFENNAYSGILLMGSNVSNININACQFKNNRRADLVLKGENIKISNCKHRQIKLCLVDKCTDVRVIDSAINRFETVNFSTRDFPKDISFMDSKIAYKESQLQTECNTLFTHCKVKCIK